MTHPEVGNGSQTFLGADVIGQSNTIDKLGLSVVGPFVTVPSAVTIKAKRNASSEENDGNIIIPNKKTTQPVEVIADEDEWLYAYDIASSAGTFTSSSKAPD